jgi:hypothetical protein
LDASPLFLFYASHFLVTDDFVATAVGEITPSLLDFACY